MSLYSSSLLVAETPPHRFSRSGADTPNSGPTGPAQRRFKSARLIGEYEKPWIEEWKQGPAGKKKPKISGNAWDRIIFWGSIVLGFALGGLMCYLAFSSVSNFDYCLILEDHFANINPDVWGYEIQRGGFGTGSFEWTTNDPKNAYTDVDGLHIVPTVTTETTDITPAQMLDGYTLNLTTAGTCTSADPLTSCSIYSNKTSGDIINPVRSARLSTKGKKTLKYGRVEVVAKMPKGDWLWPAVWMMPQSDVYGTWPQSGEIDIVESKGNDGAHYPDGRDSVISALHWGPLPEVDAFYKTNGKHTVRRTDYSEQYNTYGLEWSEKYIFTYLNSRLLQVFFLTFNSNGHKNMWQRGNFGQDIVNNSALHDPWSQTGRANTPFDEDFYLILNVAVGGTNGYFPDKVGNKPWGDQSLTAPLEFWNAENQWRPTWGEPADRGLTIKSVKMWSQGGCGSST
ncbi:concanavalin A-like lectin/glucanase domain-containing protein [Halenospora varia]|nr:concanavalin A-like lectin/glucanase domain-containing protein [Halenospora varia]